MPRNPDLVPRVITDVNGRVTTVYLKPAGTSSGKTLPAPVLPNGNLIDSLVVRAGELLGLGDRGRHDLRLALRQYSPGFLSWLTPVLGEDGEMSSRIAGMVNNGYKESLIRDSMLFQRLLSETGHHISPSHLPSLVRGLSRYDQFDDVVEFGLEDEKVQNQCIALLLVAAELASGPLTDHAMDRNRIIDDSLVGLILERTEDAALLAGVIREHHVIDPTTILGVLDGTTPSLASGAL